jgi:hypothetical protein
LAEGRIQLAVCSWQKNYESLKIGEQKLSQLSKDKNEKIISNNINNGIC